MMQLCLSDHALVSLSTNYPNFLVSEIDMSVHVVIGSDIKKSSLWYCDIGNTPCTRMTCEPGDQVTCSVQNMTGDVNAQ